MMGRHAINFYWVMRLRWGAIFGQVLVIMVGCFIIGLDLPFVPLLGLVGISVAINLLGAGWARYGGSVPGWAVPTLMAVDVALLTGLLFLTGGPANPFASLYVVHIALAAVVLRPLQTWALVGLALGCHGALFFAHRPLQLPDALGPFRGPQLGGAWLSFLVASVFIVYFVQRVTSALSRRELELARARERTVRNEKLASLATLSAGAAHELSTPLSTIAVVAKELERMLEKSDAQAAEDARLIRQQVQRCRTILNQMARDAGDASAEEARVVTIDELAQEARTGFQDAERVEVVISEAARKIEGHLPVLSLAQSLRSLVKNALQASTEPVIFRADVNAEGTGWVIRIEDRGPGMPEEVLSRAGDPFFTTKEPGSGMGLGLFLTRAVIERFEGQLDITSVVGQGTTVQVNLPAKTDGARLHVPQEPRAPSVAPLVES